jgi:hypothetical protein
MAVDLSTYKSILTNLFVRIHIPQYRTTPTGSYTDQYLYLTDRRTTYTLNGYDYTGLGRLVDISGTNSELRSSTDTLTITISGIPNSSISEIVNSKLKGSQVIVWRVLFDATTGTALSGQYDGDGNPPTRFRGFIDNYSLVEEWDSTARTSSNTIVITCASSIGVLENKISGRKTNPQSQKKFYPSDTCFDRVPTLKGATYDFGAPV